MVQTDDQAITLDQESTTRLVNAGADVESAPTGRPRTNVAIALVTLLHCLVDLDTRRGCSQAMVVRSTTPYSFTS